MENRRRGTGKKRKKGFLDFYARSIVLITGAIGLVAAFVLFRERMMALLWAILLVVVPVFFAGLVASVFLVAIEERRHRRVRRKGDGSSKENKNRKEYAGEKPALEGVRLWYEDYGKRRLDRLVDELKREGIHFVWIRPDGVCNVGTSKGYRRRAVLSDYPEQYADELARWIRRDHIAVARREGKYIRLYLSDERGTV